MSGKYTYFSVLFECLDSYGTKRNRGEKYQRRTCSFLL